MELAPALVTELLPGTLSLDAITVLDQRAGALEALARRHELDRASGALPRSGDCSPRSAVVQGLRLARWE